MAKRLFPIGHDAGLGTLLRDGTELGEYHYSYRISQREVWTGNSWKPGLFDDSGELSAKPGQVEDTPKEGETLELRLEDGERVGIRVVSAKWEQANFDFTKEGRKVILKRHGYAPNEEEG